MSLPFHPDTLLNHATTNGDASMPNFATLHFIRETSVMLQLPLQTIGTVLLYYHRYHESMRAVKADAQAAGDGSGFMELDETLVATTCIHLACKATEIPRKIRDVINVGWRFTHPDEPTLDICETYYTLRSSLVTSELIMLRALAYDLDAELPFGWALKVIRGTGMVGAAAVFRQPPPERGREGGRGERGRGGGRVEEDIHPDLATLAQLSWMFVWDSLASPKVSLTYSAPAIALACVYLATRLLKLELPMSLQMWCAVWGAREHVDVEVVKDALSDLLHFYDAAGVKGVTA